MTTDAFLLRYPRRYALVYLVIGALVTYLAIDVRYLHRITDGHDSVFAFLIPLGIGLVFAIPSLKNLITPPRVLRVDPDGITVYSGMTHQEWDEQAGRLQTTQKSGEPRLIAWDSIESISEGTVTWVRDRRLRSADGQSLNTPHRRVTQWTAPAVRILCRRDINLDGFTREGFVQTRTGYEPGEISSEDREYYSAEQLRDLTWSEVLVSTKSFSGSVADMTARLNELRKRFTR